MSQTGRIREVSSGRTDRFVPELEDNQGNATRLQQATEVVAGVVELATSTEAQAGTDTERAVTPKGLADAATGAVSAATTSAAGKVELATTTEAIAITDTSRAITAAGIGAVLGKLFVISFTGNNGAGACTATGLAVGDKVLGVAGLTTVGLAASSFEATITVVNQIQQSAVGDLSTINYLALVYRPA